MHVRTVFAQYSLTCSAPHIWNNLPDGIIGSLNIKDRMAYSIHGLACVCVK